MAKKQAIITKGMVGEIEKEVKLMPQRYYKKRTISVLPMDKMEVGDSFLVSLRSTSGPKYHRVLSKIAQACSLSKKYYPEDEEKKYAYRTIDGEGIRVWRVD